VLRNKSQFAIGSFPYNEKMKLEGYYKGIKIGDHSAKVDSASKKDSLGFSKRYLVPVGGIGLLEFDSYGADIEGLSLNSPSGRLLAQERGWKPNSKGYVLPDEIRIVSFPKSAFVIPDETGTRKGSSIVYSPKRVNFKEQVAAQGLPQDSEIAKISKQINNQSFPEDDQIAVLDNEIRQLRADQQSARGAFNSSTVAQNINALIESESQCRTAGIAMNTIDEKSKRIAKWKDNLSSCGAEVVDTGAIFSGINAINYAYGDILELPKIQEKYATKAEQLTWAKLASESQYITKTDINGDFNIDGAVDQSNSLVFAPMMSMSGERFWMQPLSSLKGKKNLNHKLLGDQNFSRYISDVIRYTCNNCSLEEYSSSMVMSGLSAPNPNQLANNFSDSEKAYAERLANLEAFEYDQNIFEESPVKAAPPQACEI